MMCMVVCNEAFTHLYAMCMQRGSVSPGANFSSLEMTCKV